MTTQRLRILYLDFDGVLHPADVWFSPEQGFRLGAGYADRHALFEHANFLAALLGPYDDVRIVLSTSWVPVIGLAEAAARLPPELANRVVDATFDPNLHGPQFGSVARGHQILDHVRRNGVSDWVALDDDARGWPGRARACLIKTDMVRGLNDPSPQTKLAAWLSTDLR
ncbi:HAD domain-containing protein [Acidovorax sacchari]|uniref:HAD domain-containing protein n=1 Tax=Acidovorax sacchari TaxID=3230736 RepID=UPI0039E298DF